MPAAPMPVMTTTAPAPSRPLTTVVPPSRALPVDAPQVAIDVEKLSFFYGAKQALFDITAKLPAKLVTAFIGPSGCGKSTFLRTMNAVTSLAGSFAVMSKRACFAP